MRFDSVKSWIFDIKLKLKLTFVLNMLTRNGGTFLQAILRATLNMILSAKSPRRQGHQRKQEEQSTHRFNTEIYLMTTLLLYAKICG
jgi:hypothetical protein